MLCIMKRNKQQGHWADYYNMKADGVNFMEKKEI